MAPAWPLYAQGSTSGAAGIAGWDQPLPSHRAGRPPPGPSRASMQALAREGSAAMSHQGSLRGGPGTEPSGISDAEAAAVNPNANPSVAGDEAVALPQQQQRRGRAHGASITGSAAGSAADGDVAVPDPNGGLGFGGDEGAGAYQQLGLVDEGEELLEEEEEEGEEGERVDPSQVMQMHAANGVAGAAVSPLLPPSLTAWSSAPSSAGEEQRQGQGGRMAATPSPVPSLPLHPGVDPQPHPDPLQQQQQQDDEEEEQYAEDALPWQSHGASTPPPLGPSFQPPNPPRPAQQAGGPVRVQTVYADDRGGKPLRMLNPSAAHAAAGLQPPASDAAAAAAAAARPARPQSAFPSSSAASAAARPQGTFARVHATYVNSVPPSGSGDATGATSATNSPRGRPPAARLPPRQPPAARPMSADPTRASAAAAATRWGVEVPPGSLPPEVFSVGPPHAHDLNPNASPNAAHGGRKPAAWGAEQLQGAQERVRSSVASQHHQRLHDASPSGNLAAHEAAAAASLQWQPLGVAASSGGGGGGGSPRRAAAAAPRAAAAASERDVASPTPLVLQQQVGSSRTSFTRLVEGCRIQPR